MKMKITRFYYVYGVCRIMWRLSLIGIVALWPLSHIGFVALWPLSFTGFSCLSLIGFVAVHEKPIWKIRYNIFEFAVSMTLQSFLVRIMKKGAQESLDTVPLKNLEAKYHVWTQSAWLNPSFASSQVPIQRTGTELARPPLFPPPPKKPSPQKPELKRGLMAWNRIKFPTPFKKLIER